MHVEQNPLSEIPSLQAPKNGSSAAEDDRSKQVDPNSEPQTLTTNSNQRPTSAGTERHLGSGGRGGASAAGAAGGAPVQAADPGGHAGAL